LSLSGPLRLLLLLLLRRWSHACSSSVEQRHEIRDTRSVASAVGRRWRGTSLELLWGVGHVHLRSRSKVGIELGLSRLLLLLLRRRGTGETATGREGVGGGTREGRTSSMLLEGRELLLSSQVGRELVGRRERWPSVVAGVVHLRLHRSGAGVHAHHRVVLLLLLRERVELGLLHRARRHTSGQASGGKVLSLRLGEEVRGDSVLSLLGEDVVRLSLRLGLRLRLGGSESSEAALVHERRREALLRSEAVARDASQVGRGRGEGLLVLLLELLEVWWRWGGCAIEVGREGGRSSLLRSLLLGRWRSLDLALWRWELCRRGLRECESTASSRCLSRSRVGGRAGSRGRRGSRSFIRRCGRLGRRWRHGASLRRGISVY
jgi:hypothetical protein